MTAMLALTLYGWLIFRCASFEQLREMTMAIFRVDFDPSLVRGLAKIALYAGVLVGVQVAQYVKGDMDIVRKQPPRRPGDSPPCRAVHSAGIRGIRLVTLHLLPVLMMVQLFDCIRRDAGLKAMALFVGAVLLIEVGLGLAAPESALAREHRMVMRRALGDTAPDLLVLGDSVARDSILVGVLGEELGSGLRIRNDALQGTGPEIAYFALKRGIDAGKVPQAILYAPSPHTLASTRMHVAAGSFCAWAEVFELLRRNPDRMDALGATLLRLSYTSRYREQIRELLKGYREVLALFRDPVIEESQRIAQYERERAGRPSVDFSRQALAARFRVPFSVAAVNRICLERFLDLASNHDIRVFWATPPCMRRAYDSRESLDFNVQYYEFLDRIGQRSNVTIVQRELPIYPDAAFYDQNLFDIPAARRFSAEMGQRLRSEGGRG